MKKRKTFRKILAVTLACTIIYQIGFPVAAWALTSGPSQPEVQSFTPASLANMVDPFTGDFSYNIPLMDIDGYPLNLGYQSGVTMDQEASWVGLGWNLNPGAVNRNVRGIPDDFAGETVDKDYNIKPNTTTGVSGGFGAELFGLDFLHFNCGLGLNYNNYTGISFEQTMSVAISAGNKGYGSNTPSLSLGFTSNNNGLSITPSFSLDEKESNRHLFDASATYNSRAGLQSFGFHYTPSALSVGNVAQGSIGRNFTFGAQTYTPKINMSMVTNSVSASFKAGITLFGQEGTGNLGGYVTSQRLLRNHESLPAFGYMYSEKAKNSDNALHDFNREKDQNFSENTPALPVTNYTNDLFTVTGQGVSGTFRPYRSDIGYVYDNFAVNQSNSYSIGVELSGTELVKVGADIGINLVSGASGAWRDKNDAAGSLQFTDNSGSSPLYEPYYFKKLGELTTESENTRFNDLGGEAAIRVQLGEGGGMDTKANSAFVNEDNTTLNIPSSTIRSHRQKRDEIITVLTQSQAQNFGLSSIIPNPNAKDYHIAAITSLRPDGSKYIYGIAAYNTLKEENTFAVGTNSDGSGVPTLDCNKGLVTYSDQQNSKGNQSGVDNYFNHVGTPAYAYSYLLTAVLSPDYMDIDNIRGPSDGDLGQYKKFTYQKVNSAYNWRVPLDHDAYKANYSEGLKSDPTDDKADYVFGQKELWYLQTIETKNFIAIFSVSQRQDALGVIDKNGGIDPSTAGRMMKLDKISLYSKADYNAHGSSAIPIKEVHFEYDYSLCANVPNNSGASIDVYGNPAGTYPNVNQYQGKLTLKRVYFTYQGSNRGAYNSYNFYYPNPHTNSNPDYNPKGFDCWGNYMPNTATSCAANSSSILNSEQCYNSQNKTLEDQYVAAWLLNKIETPTGGTINVTYESDDYAYVQDKPAMQMFQVVDLAPAPYSLPLPSSFGAHNELITSGANNLFVYFKLPQEISTGSYSTTQFVKDYTNGISQMHFKFMIDITNADRNYEYVTGYANLDDPSNFGLATDPSNPSMYEYGYIKVKDVNIGDRTPLTSGNVSPFAKAAWQYGRQSLPQKVWDGVDQTASGPEQVIEALAASDFAKNLVETFEGPNTTIMNKGYGNDIVLSKSFIRLNYPTKALSSPYHAKLGGGARVAQIQIDDNWASMTTGLPASYGQTFTYTTIDPSTGKMISSGVATNEPGAGGEQNVLHQPVWFGNKDQVLLAPDDKFYMEEPFGEGFYPAPSVGYSEVRIRSILPANVKKHSSGYNIHKFYTAKDFPVLTSHTGLDAEPKESEPLLKLFYSSHKKYMTASQGFVIELNDMNGKPKAEEIYAYGQDKPISKKEYFYNSEKTSVGTNKLVNTATVINPDGTNQESTIGLDYDIVGDMREQESQTFSTQVGLNLNTFVVIIPIPVPTSFPMITKEDVRFRSAVVTKVITRYGLLNEVDAYDQTSKVVSKNLAYDAETGDVLLTQTNNSYDDPVYTFTYPAHWYYDGMGGAYKNIASKYNLTISSGSASYANANKYFVAGDQLMLEPSSGTALSGWVSSVSSSTVSIINDAGLAFSSGNYNVTILASGRKNLQTNHMGSFTCGVNPLPYIRNGNINNVLKADALEYSDDVITFCECFQHSSSYIFNSQNPYLTGQKGVWHVLKNYTYLTDRQLTTANNTPDLRFDGVFTKFTPFWNFQNNQWNMNNTNWTWPSQVTVQSPYNVELENENALNQYQSAIFGYNQSIPTAISQNARYRDIGFDNFEDYAYPTCTDDHFSYRSYIGNLSNTEAHSGKSSMMVPSSGFIINLHKNVTP